MAAVQMGLIYVNPGGPNGNPDPIAAARDIRETVGYMAMNDGETVASIAGGHAVGQAPGTREPSRCVGAEPAAATVDRQGLAWENKRGSSNASDTVSGGLEGVWSANPIAFTTQYLHNLFQYERARTKRPAGALQRMPGDKGAADLVPDARDKPVRHAPIMFTTDLSLKFDPAYREISLRFNRNPEKVADAFARAWFKLTHRDVGPRSRDVGKDAPSRQLTWQDPLPCRQSGCDPFIGHHATEARKSGVGFDRSGARQNRAGFGCPLPRNRYARRLNGAPIRLEPQTHWPANSPAELDFEPANPGIRNGRRFVNCPFE